MKGKKLGFICFTCLLLVLLASCGRLSKESDPEATTSLADRDPSKLDDVTLDGMTEDILSQMTLAEKIGQMFIVSTDSLDFNAETGMTDKMKQNLEEYKPGGVVFFSFNLESRKQIQQFVLSMQDDSDSIPLFIAVDEEGGSVSRIANTEGMDTTRFPSMAEIGKTNDPDQAYEVGETIARDISALGFNLDFAPVCDITTNESNTEIGDRSFGSDADLVASMVRQEVKGLQGNGVSATLKHFPGQGDSGEDTHRGSVNIETTIDELRKTEFVPFKSGIAAGADFVMVSHVSVESVTGTETPASLSKLMVSDILRDELGFEGVIITDAMNMKSITKFYDSDQGALRAVEAGNDILLMPDNFEAAYEAIMDAVEDGTISESRINESVSRILRVKIRRGIIPLTSGLIRENGG